jgi:hypothetical protein
MGLLGRVLIAISETSSQEPIASARAMQEDAQPRLEEEEDTAESDRLLPSDSKGRIFLLEDISNYSQTTVLLGYKQRRVRIRQLLKILSLCPSQRCSS